MGNISHIEKIKSNIELIETFDKKNKNQKNKFKDELCNFFKNNEAYFFSSQGKNFSLTKPRLLNGTVINYLDFIIENKNINVLGSQIQNNQAIFKVGKDFSEKDLLEIENNIKNSFNKLYSELWINSNHPFTIELHNYDKQELGAFKKELKENSLDIFANVEGKEYSQDNIYYIYYDYKNYNSKKSAEISKLFSNLMRQNGYDCGVK